MVQGRVKIVSEKMLLLEQLMTDHRHTAMYESLQNHRGFGADTPFDAPVAEGVAVASECDGVVPEILQVDQNDDHAIDVRNNYNYCNHGQEDGLL